MPPLSTNQLWLVAESLSASLASGAALPGALAAMAEDAPRLRSRLLSIASALQQGQTLGEALAAQGGAFPPDFVATVQAGEQTNQLDAAVRRLAEHYREVRHSRYHISLALLYPFLLLVMLAGLFAIIMMIVPSFEEMYREMGIELPGLTILIIRIGRHAVAIATAVAVLIVAGTVAISLAWRSRRTRAVIEQALLLLPVFRVFYRSKALRHFCETMAMLLTAGHPLADSLRHASASSPSVIYSNEIDRLRRIVEQGGLMSDGMDWRRLFPRHFRWVVSTAEKRGELAPALADLGPAYGRTSSRQLSLISRFTLAGFLVFLIGPSIGMIVLGMFLPLIKLMSSVGQ